MRSLSPIKLLCGLLLFAAVALPGLASGDFNPVAKGAPPALASNPGDDAVRIDLRNWFEIPGLENGAIRVQTSLGTFHLALLPEDAPLTVENYLRYVRAGIFNNTFFHRSVPGFVVQGGGFLANSTLSPVTTFPPVRNEFKIPNTRGTVAMAKLGGDPDSATSQWFVNLADNRSNLDNQNGGFTVFARVLGNGMEIVDAIAALPRYNLGGAFGETPLRNVQPSQTELYLSNLVEVEQVLEVPLFPTAANPGLLEFSATSNNPGLILRIEGSELVLRRDTLNGQDRMAGDATVTLTARNPEGNTANTTLQVLNSVPDLRPPVISISAPTANARIFTSSATVLGTASDDVGIREVLFRATSGGDWARAAIAGSGGRVTWNATVSLAPGTNLPEFKSIDLAGKESPVQIRQLQYLKPSETPLAISISGNGTISGALAGKNLFLNMPYQVKATAASGFVFQKWTDQNGTVLSRSPDFTFTMQDGLALHPVFIPSPFPALAGIYNLLLKDEGAVHTAASQPGEFTALRAGLSLTVSAGGALSGALRFDGQTHALRGQLDADRGAIVTIPRRGKTPLQISLNLHPGEQEGIQPILHASLLVAQSGNTTLPLTGRAPRVEFTGRQGSLHPLQCARFTTALVPSAQRNMGNGYALMRVDPSGRVLLAGKLPDGTAYSHSASLNRAAPEAAMPWELPVFLPPHGKSNGLLCGQFGLAEAFSEEKADVLGQLEWARPANIPKSGMYPAGFVELLSATGARIIQSSALPAAPSPTAFTLRISPLEAASWVPVQRQGTWTAKSGPVLIDTPKTWSMRYTPASGLMAGSLPNPVPGAIPSALKWEGVLFSKNLVLQDGSTPLRGTGHLLFPTSTGRIEIEFEN